MAMIQRIQQDAVEGARFGRFNLADNSTAVIWRVGTTVIDSGPPNQWREVRAYLEERPFERLVLTHHHEDHSGNAARIARHFHVPVHVRPEGVGPLQGGFPLRFYQKLFWGRPPCFTPSEMPGEIEAGEGYRLVPIHTPGHSPDHVCFLEPERGWLFTGDLYLATRPRLFRADEDLSGEMASLARVLETDFQVVFCSHKGVVADGPRVIREKLDYFRGLVGQVKRLHGEGTPVPVIAERLLGKRDKAGVISWNHICQENLVRACLEVPAASLSS